MSRNKELILSPYTYLPNGTGASINFVEDKKAIFEYLVKDKLARTIGMFEYSGFPETFDSIMLEIYLQTQGFAIVTKVNDDLYVLNGTLGGEPNASYKPTLATPVSPYLNFSKTCAIGQDCIVVKANELYTGFGEINSLFAGMLSDAYATLRLQLINSRIPSIWKVEDEASKQKAETYFKNVIDGKLSAFVGSDSLEEIVESLSVHDYTNKGQQQIKDTMEVIQYLQARWNIEFGLNDNYNMKREAINSTEVDSNTMPLMTGVLSQLESRKKGVEEINRLYGTNGSVKLGENWARAYEYVIQALENAENDNEQENPNEIEEERKEIEQ